ncbi:MAG TPA: DUF3006 domain-containing protein [Chthonomonadaceae bacterium]|nr:DUF3006 domain-containing protein [Chthonomonadaceae bacterium]
MARSEKPAPRVLRVYLDRIEDGIAVLLCGEEPVYEWPLPQAFLPDGAREGEWLECRLTRDVQTTQETKARNASLLEQLLHPPEET